MNSSTTSKVLETFEVSSNKIFIFLIKTSEILNYENLNMVDKGPTFYIERFSDYYRARVSPLVRKILSFSKMDKWHNLAIGWFSGNLIRKGGLTFDTPPFRFRNAKRI